ncbi:homoserine kinase [Cloacibacillus porcorum]|uniref:Homoserine kinase n=1 Tax=Cloacibacillus porcorum TaxID=1197717 RepID=A0A1B2I4I3_9BACT|nr:homoserine kinase [Cloacibacillus porcorum]ANZ44857.1 homoserine kinase [Cloacibacillus porcorum]
MNHLITLRVPATSANLGSGFDAIGMAVSLYNIFKVIELRPAGEYEVEAHGEGSRELSSPKANLVVKAYEDTCERWKVKGPGFSLWCHNIIPLCRGLGSSAGAVVAGVLIAKYLTGYEADEDELLRAMTVVEGHPDNVAPCYLGGMVVSCWDGQDLRYVNLPALPPEVLCVVAVPDERVKTSDARKALPKEVPFGDAVFNVGRAALLTAAWATGKWDYLKWGMDDKLHQPYRSKLFSGGEVIFSRVEALPECLSVAISGSGPSVIALVKGTTQRVAEAMCRTFTEYGVRSQFFVLDGSAQGARVDVSMELAEALAAAAGLSPKGNTDVCSCEPGTADKAGGCR